VLARRSSPPPLSPGLWRTPKSTIAKSKNEHVTHASNLFLLFAFVVASLCEHHIRNPNQLSTFRCIDPGVVRRYYVWDPWYLLTTPALAVWSKRSMLRARVWGQPMDSHSLRQKVVRPSLAAPATNELTAGKTVLAAVKCQQRLTHSYM